MWSPLNVLTHFSPCVGLSKPDDLLKKCKEYGHTACAITDNCTLSGTVDFIDKAKKHGVKPIIGTRFGETIVLAKNYQGWLNLIKMTSNKNILEYQGDKSLIAITPDDYTEESLNILRDNFDQIYTYSEAGCEQPVLYVDSSSRQDYEVLISAEVGQPLSKLHEITDDRTRYLKGQYSLPNMGYGSKNQEIVEQCEEFAISKGLNLPEFVPPAGISQYDYMVQLCREGWKKKVQGVISKEKEQEYVDRIKMELGVIKEIGLEGYFLIVQDYISFARKNNWLVGPSRGSVGGCLAAYLMYITGIDPIYYGLSFERFYNAGRNTKDNKTMPDIDTDFPRDKRELVIEYIKNKYGHDKVAQIVTFHELKGKSSIKEVLRAHKAVSNDEMNNITKFIPSKEEISDLLADSNESSILRWTLQNEPDILKDWVTIDDEGNLNGDMFSLFEQAIRLEGTIIGTGKHASGIVIAKDPLAECCPMMDDKDGEKICGFDMSDLEKAGFVKFDILGVAVLDKLMGINNLLRYGKIKVEV